MVTKQLDAFVASNDVPFYQMAVVTDSSCVPRPRSHSTRPALSRILLPFSAPRCTAPRQLLFTQFVLGAFFFILRPWAGLWPIERQRKHQSPALGATEGPPQCVCAEGAINSDRGGGE